MLFSRFPIRAVRQSLLGCCLALTASALLAQDQEWPTYGGDLASTRYSPLDIVSAENFNDMDSAWEFDTRNFGPSPEYRFQSTPLMVNRTLYSTVGSRRAVVALDAVTGELLWMHRIDKGARGRAAPSPRVMCAAMMPGQATGYGFSIPFRWRTSTAMTPG